VSDLFVSATVHFDDAEQGIDAMERRARALGPAFRELKAPMRADQKEHGKQERGPFGSWARRSPKTLEFYRSHGRKRIPKPQGRLLSAVKYTSTAYSLIGESRVPWSGAQADGAVVGRGAKLKARPSLWISRKLLDIAEAVIERSLLSAYGGRG
jgi:hypothetical protein